MGTPSRAGRPSLSGVVTSLICDMGKEVEREKEREREMGFESEG